MKIAIIKLEKTLKSALYAIEELFFINNKFCKKESEVHIDTQILSLDKLDDKTIYDVIIVPPQMGDENFNFKIPKLNKWLNTQYHKGSIISSACVGSFFLADAKLLENKKATTHWAYTKLFEDSFPNVKLNSDKILIEDNRIITAGGVSAYMDLCLYLVEKFHSNKTASTLANLLVVDKTRTSQKSYKDFSTIFLFDDEEIKECYKMDEKKYTRTNLKCNFGKKTKYK